MSRTEKPARRSQVPISEGRINLSYRCVPRGSNCATCSAPTMPRRKASGVLFNVERNKCPPGFSVREMAEITDTGSGTCSNISRQVTMSNDAGRSADICSTLASSYETFKPDSSRCNLATSRTRGATSMAVTVAPIRASDSDSIPPPHPTSSALAPWSEHRELMYFIRAGLRSCKGFSGPSGSHQPGAARSKFCCSCGSKLPNASVISAWLQMLRWQRS